MREEARFRMVEQADPQRFASLLQAARQHVASRFAAYERLAQPPGAPATAAAAAPAPAARG
jgi:hypothetical protein